jgi:hypothetical protein
VTPFISHMTSPGRDIPGPQVPDGPREAAVEEGTYSLNVQKPILVMITPIR